MESPHDIEIVHRDHEPVAAAILAAVKGGILPPGAGDWHGLMSWDSLRFGG